MSLFDQSPSDNEYMEQILRIIEGEEENNAAVGDDDQMHPEWYPTDADERQLEADDESIDEDMSDAYQSDDIVADDNDDDDVEVISNAELPAEHQADDIADDNKEENPVHIMIDSEDIIVELEVSAPEITSLCILLTDEPLSYLVGTGNRDVSKVFIGDRPFDMIWPKEQFASKSQRETWTAAQWKAKSTQLMYLVDVNESMWWSFTSLPHWAVRDYVFCSAFTKFQNRANGPNEMQQWQQFVDRLQTVRDAIKVNEFQTVSCSVSLCQFLIHSSYDQTNSFALRIAREETAQSVTIDIAFCSPLLFCCCCY